MSPVDIRPERSPVERRRNWKRETERERERERMEKVTENRSHEYVRLPYGLARIDQ